MSQPHTPKRVAGQPDWKTLSGTVPFAGLLLNLMAGRMEENPSTERVDER